MDNCHIQIQSTPQIGFAHRFDTTQYEIYNIGDANQIEICYILSGDITVENLDTGAAFTVPAGSLVCLPYQNSRYHCHSKQFHRHVTAAIRMQYAYSTEGGLLLPQYMTFGEDSEDGGRIRYYLETLAREHCLQTGETASCAQAMTLLGMVAETYQRRCTENSTYGKKWYVDRARQYVAEHLDEMVCVPDVAAHLEITPGYLSHLFKESTGMTLSSYINTVRVERLEMLVVHYDIPLRDAAVQVGLQDPNYASRLFKMVRGDTVSEAKRLRTVTMELRQEVKRAAEENTSSHIREESTSSIEKK